LHHIVFDFVSSEVFLAEFRELYEAYAAGRPARLKPMRVQYLDCSYWQEKQCDQAKATGALRFWKDTIGTGDAVPVVSLPADLPGGEELRFEPALERFEIPASLCRKVRASGARHKTTNFCVFLSAFQILLHRYSG